MPTIHDQDEITDHPVVIRAIEEFLAELKPAQRTPAAASKLTELIKQIERKAAEATEAHIKKRITEFRNRVALVLATVAAVLVLFNLPKSPGGLIRASYPPQQIFKGMTEEVDPPPPLRDGKPEQNRLSPWIRREVIPALVDPKSTDGLVQLLSSLRAVNENETDSFLKLASSEATAGAVRNRFARRWPNPRLEVFVSRLVSDSQTSCQRNVDHSQLQAVLLIPANSDPAPWFQCNNPMWPTVFVQVATLDHPDHPVGGVELIGKSVRAMPNRDCSKPEHPPECDVAEIQLTSSALTKLMQRPAGAFSGRLVGEVGVEQFVQGNARIVR